MKKLNKKGFTLIEMLVVIAIIAILVAIIVPTVTKANSKAAAATNAANLRTYAAELAIAELNGEIATTLGTTEVAATSITANTGYTAPTVPSMKKIGDDVAAGNAAVKVSKVNNEIKVTASDKTIDQLATYAEHASWTAPVASK